MTALVNARFRACAKDVVKALLGEPNRAQSKPTEWRWGSRGSFSFDPVKGTWHDHEIGQGGGVIDLVMREMGSDREAAVRWLREQGHIEATPNATRTKTRIVETYPYTDENGALLFEVCRLEPKDFRQRRPDGQGDWSWKTQGVRRVLFQLPCILEAVGRNETIFVVEGEKSALRLAALDLVATCSPGGAGKWKPECSKALRGADVVILPDNDEPGRHHAEAVAKALTGIAARVRVLCLPDLPVKGDVFDWLAGGHTPAELMALMTGAADYDGGALDPKTIIAPDWHDNLLRDERGQAYANVANVLMILRADPEYSAAFAYDQMACVTLLAKALDTQAEPFSIRAVTDDDVTHIQERLQMLALPRVGKEVMHQAIDCIASERSFHPLRDYLSRLEWDGVSRLDTWLTAYLGVEETAYSFGIGRMFLISMIARILKPGCKADYMLILEGEQGARKSTACAILGGDWYSDDLPDLKTGKDVALHLRGKWLIEVAELAAMGRADQETLKKFLTKNVERYRPPYGVREVVQERQCIFVGTTNRSTYLTDETGGRRYWPVKVGEIDTDALQCDRDQLFAEAVQAFRKGEKWWPDADFEATCIRPQQEERFEQDEWEALIAAHLDGQSRTTIQRVAVSALHFEDKKIGTTEQRRIGKILDRLGWRRAKTRGTGGIRWWEMQS